ncbi:OmpA/MotB family protein [Clostridium cadaveris]|uniref:OmpA/MotB family protein n=1 Tax=Clostridium cadaveris TaxID=1529 RepID=UPI0015B60512|nr:OmpA family protein [Clostridium cadaveris]NWK12606.1 OmpA family protein [Clostridium cadaveris]UFH63599.1 OmpA family protein [Clostridium cadaveris]
MYRKKRKKDDINSNSWMDTYADTITLLLTFFILLYSFSTIDNEKLKAVAYSLKSQVSGEEPITIDETDKNIDNITPGIGAKSEYDILVEKITKLLQQNGLTDLVKIREEDAGVILQIGDNIMFDTADARLKGESKKVLDVVSSLIPKINNEIMIQGHTDNRPIKSSQYESNWELSTARAFAVLKYFINDKHLDPKRFSATGYGEYRPIVENSSEENMEINRRVDILIVQEREKAQ